MDQEIYEAQQRLLKKREEREEMSVMEDLGYQKNTIPNLYPLFPKRNEQETYPESRNSSERHKNSMRIHFIQGFAKGRTFWYRKDIAQEMIDIGMAKEVK